MKIGNGYIWSTRGGANDHLCGQTRAGRVLEEIMSEVSSVFNHGVVKLLEMP